MSEHDCSASCAKHGFYGVERVQRYRCKVCGRTFHAEKLFGALRTRPETIKMVVKLLVEGVGVRAAARVVGIHRDTVLSILRLVGARCQRLLDLRLRKLKVGALQFDEIWAFIGAKQRTVDKEGANAFGSAYTFVATEPATRLIITQMTGKRESGETEVFLRDVKSRCESIGQITTDHFTPYVKGIPEIWDWKVPFATQQKEYTGLDQQRRYRRAGKQQYRYDADSPERRYSPAWGVARCETRIIVGKPTPWEITTTDIERLNLQARMNNRRMGRLTNQYSKKLEYHRLQWSLWAAHWNFCRTTRKDKITPMQRAGLEEKAWTIHQLFLEGLKA